VRLRRPALLIAEEDPLEAATLRAALGAMKVEAAFAGDSDAALASFGDDPPDLVLLSVSLPGLDGYSTGERMLQKKKVPILYLTGRAFPHSDAEAREHGGAGYLTKPVSVAELRRKVAKALSS